MSEMIERIKKRAQWFNDRNCLGQTVESLSGEFHTMTRLALEFDDSQPVFSRGTNLSEPLASKMVRAEKKIILFTDALAQLLPPEPSNSVIEACCARVILREIWWYNKGEAVHETTLAHLKSPESVNAFLSGYKAAANRNN